MDAGPSRASRVVSGWVVPRPNHAHSWAMTRAMARWPSPAHAWHGRGCVGPGHGLVNSVSGLAGPSSFHLYSLVMA